MLDTVALVRPGLPRTAALRERLAALEAGKARRAFRRPRPPPGPRAVPPGDRAHPGAHRLVRPGRGAGRRASRTGRAGRGAARPRRGRLPVLGGGGLHRVQEGPREGGASPRTSTPTTTWASPTRRWASSTTRCRSSSVARQGCQGQPKESGLPHDDRPAPGDARRAAAGGERLPGGAGQRARRPARGEGLRFELGLRLRGHRRRRARRSASTWGWQKRRAGAPRRRGPGAPAVRHGADPRRTDRRAPSHSRSAGTHAAVRHPSLRRLPRRARSGTCRRSPPTMSYLELLRADRGALLQRAGQPLLLTSLPSTAGADPADARRLAT